MQLLLDFSDYNLWANTRMCQWLQEKPEALLTRETPSSFPTLRGALLHIWGAQDIWLRRLSGETPTGFLANDFKGSNSELFDGLLDNSRHWSDFLRTVGEPFFSGHTEYRNLKGDVFQTSNAQIALHCLQHSTYHRGQIVTMARALGLIDPPQTDYIAYTRVH
jgi:uncharacterized damage-inducible protein DinB